MSVKTEVEKQDATKNYICQFCSMLFTRKNNCLRHEKGCSYNPSKPEFVCANCKTSFMREDNLRIHLKKCFLDNIDKPKKSRTPCLNEECTFTFYHKTALVNHLRSNHKDIIVKEPITKTFQTYEEFSQWKELEEENTFSYFSQKGGKQNSKLFQYYYCQQDGSAKLHSERKTNRCRAKGRIKLGHHCIAKMKVWQDKNKTINVQYFPTHSHRCSPQDVAHHPLPKKISTFIDKQISEKVSPSEIFQKVADTYISANNENPNLKINFLTKKLISERARRRMSELIKPVKAVKRGPPNSITDVSDFHTLSENLSEPSTTDVEIMYEELPNCMGDGSDFHILSSIKEEIVSQSLTNQHCEPDKTYDSIISRIDTNMSVINSFIASAKQNQVSEHALTHVDAVLLDLVESLQNRETDHDYVLGFEPVRTVLKQEKLNTEDESPHLISFKRPEEKPKSFELDETVEKKMKVLKTVFACVIDIGEKSTVSLTNGTHNGPDNIS